MVMTQKANKLLILMIAALLLFSIPVSVYAEEEEKKAEKSDGKKVLGIETVLPKEKLSKQYKRIVIKNISFEGTTIRRSTRPSTLISRTWSRSLEQLSRTT